MAKIKLGPVVGQASGSHASTVFSHNRYGPYIRNRVIPVKRITSYTILIKQQFITNSKAWNALDAANRLAWNLWAQNNPYTDTLGASQTLTGHAAFCKINGSLNWIGEADLLLPPAVPAPAPLTSLSLTADIGAGDVELIFTPTPITTTKKLWLRAAVVDSTGITYVENQLKLVYWSDVAATSPTSIQAAVEGRFGPLAVGHTVHVRVHLIDSATGLISPPLAASAPVTTT